MSPYGKNNLKEQRTLISALISFLLAYFTYTKLPNPHECISYLEQPITIISDSIHWYCQQVIVMNIFLIVLILTGIGFLVYWSVFDRIKNKYNFVLTSKKEKIKTKWEIVITIVIAGIGISSMYIGIDTLLLEPPIQQYHNYKENIELLDGERGQLELKFYAPNGIMQTYGIHTEIFVTIPEKVNNTTTIQMKFPKAGIMIDSNGMIPTVGEIISLNYSESNSIASTYTFKDLSLVYQYPGQYDAILKINKTNEPSKNFESVIAVADWNKDYLDRRSNYQTQGFGWIVFGISIIMTATIFTNLVDLRYKYFELKRKEFYE